MSRTDCIRLALIGVLLIAMMSAYPAGGQQTETELAPINALREDDELAPLTANAALNALAAQYLAGMVGARCLCPARGGDAGAATVLDDVRDALGSDSPVLDAGLTVGYDQSAARAITTTAFDPANGSVILGAGMTQIGIATETIESGEGWLVPPPGGDGPAIDLSGYTVAVIVTSGSVE